jgi:hypothetical protein
LATSTRGLTRLSAGCSVLPNEFTVDGEQDRALLWAKVLIGVDGLSDGRGAVVAQLVHQDVPERTGQRAWTYAQARLDSPCRVALRVCRKRLSGSVTLAVALGLGASCGRRLSVRGVLPLALAVATWAATRCW